MNTFQVAAVILLSGFCHSMIFGQSNEPAEAKIALEYELPGLPVASAAELFSVTRPQSVTEVVGLKGSSDAMAAEGDFGDLGVIYRIDLKQRWRVARFENASAICSLVHVPRRQEVISSSWDFKIRFHDDKSLQLKGAISVDRSAARLAITRDEKTLEIINEGYADRDISAGRTLWTVDVEGRSQKTIFGPIGFRAFHLGISPDGQKLAICGGLFEQPSGRIIVRNVTSGDEDFGVAGSSCFWKLAWSDDGRWLAATSSSGTVVLDAKTGKEKAASTIGGRVLHIPPGTENVMVSRANQLHVLNLPDLKFVKTIDHEFGRITSIASLDDNQTLVTGSTTGLQQWNRTDWSSERIVANRSAVVRGTSPTFLPKHNLIAVADGSELRFCDADTGSLTNSRTFAANIRTTSADDQQTRLGVILDDGSVHSLEVLTGLVKKLGNAPKGTRLTLSRDLRAVIGVAADGQLMRYQLNEGTQQFTPQRLPGTVTSLTVAEHGEICCGLSSGAVVVFDANLERELHRIAEAANSGVTCVAWSKQPSRLVIGESSGQVTVFNQDSQGRFHVAARQMLQHESTVIELSAVSDLIAVGHPNGSVSILSAAGNEPIQTVASRIPDPIAACLILKYDSGIVTANRRGALSRIKLQQLPVQAIHSLVAENNQPIHSACFNVEGDECFIAVGASIEVKSMKSWQTTQILKGHRAMIQRVRLSPDARYLASTGEDSLLVIRTKNGDSWEIDRAMFLTARAHRVEWSPDGRWLLFGAVSHEIGLIDTQSWEIVHTFSVPFIPNTLSFSPNGQWFVSGGVNTGNQTDLCKIQVWDARGWKDGIWSEPKTVAGHLWGVEGIAVTENGQQFYSVSADSELIEWSTLTGGSRKVGAFPLSATSFSLLRGDRFAIASWHFGNLGIVDLIDGKNVVLMEGHSKDGKNVLMRDVVVSKDSQWAISSATADLGQGTGSVRLWRIGKPSQFD